MERAEQEAKIIDFRQKRLEKLDTESLTYLLKDKAGRWFLMRLMDRCHIFSTTFPDTGNINEMLANEGERRVALTLKSNIRMLGEEMHKKYQLAEKEYADFDREITERMKMMEEQTDV